MPDATAADPGPSPVRDGARDGPAPHPEGARPRGRPCTVCRAPVASPRARYCSHACRQRAYRLRGLRTTAAEVAPLAAEVARRGDRAAHTVYECPVCGERALGERRCPDCHRFRRALGLGGACPQCDEPILVAEVLGTEVTAQR
jgi:hypothetical protein